VRDLVDFPVGARVRVVNPQHPTFDDYEVGDSAVILSAKELYPGFVSLRVQWDKPRYPVEAKELDRCNTLYATEVEVVWPT
jgi:hypothetical protein